MARYSRHSLLFMFYTSLEGFTKKLVCYSPNFSTNTWPRSQFYDVDAPCMCGVSSDREEGILPHVYDPCIKNDTPHMHRALMTSGQRADLNHTWLPFSDWSFMCLWVSVNILSYYCH